MIVGRRTPTFILERCPRCLAPLPYLVNGRTATFWLRTPCSQCFRKTDTEANAEYDRRLAAGRVVASVHETYESVKRP